ncbi:MAG: PEP-CTERM sorting domain-containing protein, partial [Gemmatimonadaceae bacterium]
VFAAAQPQEAVGRDAALEKGVGNLHISARQKLSDFTKSMGCHVGTLNASRICGSVLPSWRRYLQNLELFMMSFMRVGLLAGSAALLAIAAPVNAAVTTYTYSGFEFSSVKGPYTTSDRVTGSITLASSLPSNLTTFTAVAPISFSFGDGVDTLTNTSLNVGSLFAFKTDASGEIYAWQAVVYVGSASQLSINTVNAPGILPVYDAVYVNSGNTAYGQILNSPGTWTVTAVPEPETYAMFLAGLGLLGVHWRRRSRH